MDKRRKKIIEEAEKIDEMGQESESKGRKAVQEVAKETEAAEKKKEDEVLNKLDSIRKNRYTYRVFLLNYLHEMVREIKWPTTYSWGVWFDGIGIVLGVRDKFGKLHKKAFKPSYQPKFDAHACYQFAVWAEDVLDMVEGSLEIPKTEGGIWLPNKTKTQMPN